MGVHRDHRGQGHGRAVTVAAAAALRDMGSCSALVATPSANVGAVGTYQAAGFEAVAAVHDHYREPSR
jgi:ribosomal protein S18 acetylase RimI-like enzyme